MVGGDRYEPSFLGKSNEEILEDTGFYDGDEDSVFDEIEEMYGEAVREVIEEEVYDLIDTTTGRLTEEEREKAAEYLGEQILDDLKKQGMDPDFDVDDFLGGGNGADDSKGYALES